MKRIWLIGLFALGLIACSGELAELSMNENEIESVAVEVESVSDDASTETLASPTALPEASPTETASTPTLQPTAEAKIEPTKATMPGIELFSFADGEPGWYTVDDNVMGGVSNSTAVIDADKLLFSGTMSLENNGGFASVRSDWRLTDLTGADGVLLRVLGDGKAYRLRIRTAVTGRDISYNAIFETTPDVWQLVYIPFADMVPTYRGFVMDVEPLDPATIGSFGVMLSDKQPGEFGLFVDWIRAVTEQDLQTMES